MGQNSMQIRGLSGSILDAIQHPKLKINRSWSAPGKRFISSQIIAQVLAELTGLAAATCRRALKNIEIGMLRATKATRN